MSYCSRSRRRRFTVPDFKVGHIVSFTTVFSNICTAHAHKRLFMNFRYKFCSIFLPRFPIRVQNFGDLATFPIDFCIFLCWKSAIFLLPVCLAHWPRKYTTGVDSHSDNFHQIWSWYDHSLLSYSVLPADTSCILVTTTFDVLTLNSWHAWRVTWPTLPPSLKTLRLSVLQLWVITFPIGYL